MWPAKFSLKPEPDFLSHLEELRRRLIVSLFFFFLAAILCYVYSRPLLGFLTRPLDTFSDSTNLFFRSPQEGFLLYIKTAALAGFVLSSPVFLTQTWLFLAPGLYGHEKKIVFLIAAISLFFFLTGVFFAYGVVIPWGLEFLLSFQTDRLKPLLEAGPYFSFLSAMILAFGLLFNVPVLVVGLVKLGVLSTASIRRARRGIIVFLFLLAAILTPSPDPLSQLILAVPLLVLFEASLFLAAKLEKNPLRPSVDRT